MKARASLRFFVFIILCLTASHTLADTIKLKNGETHEGEITKEDEKSVILRTRDAGFKVFDRSEIAEIIHGDAKKPPVKKDPKPVEKPRPIEKPAETKKTEQPGSKLDVVTMKDGTVHKGTITNENDQFLTIRIPQSGFKVLRKEDIEKTERAKKEKKENGKTTKKPVSLPAGDVTDILKELTGKEPISGVEALKRIVKLGEGALPTLLRLLRSELGKMELPVVAGAIARLKDEDTVGQVRSFLSVDSRNTQLNALAVLERIGDPEAVDVLLKCMLGVDKEIGAVADRAVAATLRKSPNNHAVFMTVHDAARSAQKNGKTRIARVLGGSGSRFAVSPLLTLIGDWEASVKVAAVIAVGRLGFNDDDTCNEVRRLLKSEDTQVKREAALALGRLQDLESVDSLIGLLKDENRGIRKNAHWSLKSITGLRFPDNHTRWKFWWDKESGKYKKQRESLLYKLRTGTNEERLKVIDQLAGIRLGSKKIIAALLEQTSSGDKQIRIKVCKALAGMNARNAVPDLIKQLDDIEMSVKDAVHTALKAITGQDLPPERKEWEKWLRSSNW